MLMTKNTHIAISLCFTAIFSACSGSDGPETQGIDLRPKTVPEINQPQSISGPLVKAGKNSVSRYLKNGIYTATQTPDPALEVTTAVPARLSDGFSTTNTQEVGVDEADRMEYDGNYLYLAAYPEWIEGSSYQAHVRVLARQEDFSLNQVAELNLTDKNANINGIYLSQNRLAVVSTNSPVYSIDSRPIEPWAPTKSRLALDVYDTTIPANSQATLNIEFDGNLLSSRRIDDQLYLITTYVPTVDGLLPGASTDEEKLANYLKILDTPDAELMPKMYVNESSQPLNAPQDCAIPTAATERDGYAQLITLIRVNLQQPDDISASCLSTVANVVYMSTNSIYLAGTTDTQTALHKISLDNELSYQASGSVNGIIGWRGPGNLRLSEKDDYLRIVTSDYQPKDPEHVLTILSQQGNELLPIAQLPNEDNPEPIGKVGEDIFAVRFFNDRAYLVTFERIDPLYVIDLADPFAPQILGALEIPGFSSYLHPLDNHYLLGVGQQVSAENIPATGTAPAQPATQQGMKVSLFDISNPSAPIEVNSIVKEQAYTPVEYNYQTLSVLNTAGAYQFAMPLEEWTQNDGMSIAIWQPKHSLMLLDVDTQSAQPSLIERAQIYANSERETYIYAGDDRSVIHGEHVYYIHGNQVWHSLWQSETGIDGPY